MWTDSTLALPDALATVTCSTVAAHPWTPGLGQVTEDGTYLSPANATAWLAGRLSGVPVGHDVTAWLITAPTLAGFITRLTALAAVFPQPLVTQVQRRAATAQTHATTRMQIPATPGGLPAATTLSVSSARRAQNAGAAIQAATDTLPGMGASLDTVTQALASFAAERASALQALSDTLAGLQAATASLWTLSVARDVAAAREALTTDVPQTDAVFALALLFVGEDLSALRALTTETPP